MIQGVPDERQTLLFSATMPGWVKGLTQRFLKNPILVDLVGDEQSGKIAEGVRWGCLSLSALWHMHGRHAIRQKVLPELLGLHMLLLLYMPSEDRDGA